MPLGVLQHYTIEPADLERTRDFYCEVLGLEVGERPPLGFPGYWLYSGGVATVHLLGPRKPREGTKQEVVLAMLRRPEGATVAQIAEATGWAQHTVRGFFAGLKKRQGITVEIAERIRQVGPNKQGAKGSYTVYRVAE